MSFLHLSQMDPPVDEALGKIDIFSEIWVRLTFGQMYPPVEASSGQLDIWQPLDQADLWSDVPLSRGIEWSRVVLLQVSLTFGKPLGQADFWSDITPGRGI